MPNYKKNKNKIIRSLARAPSQYNLFNLQNKTQLENKRIDQSTHAVDQPRETTFNLDSR
jgi:hypothetical protein